MLYIHTVPHLRRLDSNRDPFWTTINFMTSEYSLELKANPGQSGRRPSLIGAVIDDLWDRRAKDSGRSERARSHDTTYGAQVSVAMEK
jgi:hypothetical protein